MRNEVLEEGRLEAKDTVAFHLRHEYEYGYEYEDVDIEYSLPVILGFYEGFLWSYIYEAYGRMAAASPVVMAPAPEGIPEGKLTYDELEMMLGQRDMSLYPTAYKWAISKEELDSLLEIYDEAVADAEDVVSGAIDDYFKEKLVYGLTVSFCCHKLADLLAENDATFIIRTYDFTPDKFHAYVTLESDPEADLIIETTRATVYEDTLRAINKLKDPDAMYELKLLGKCFKA